MRKRFRTELEGGPCRLEWSGPIPLITVIHSGSVASASTTQVSFDQANGDPRRGEWSQLKRRRSKEISTVADHPAGDSAAVAMPNRTAASPVWVNGGGPAVARERQLHPSKPTNPPVQSIVSSVP
jgi:hypothetical protein